MDTEIQHIWLDLHEELGKFLRSKVHDVSLADDLLQEVFIKMHLNIGQLKDPAKLTAWAYRIARNTISDHFKQPRFSPEPDPATAAEETDEDLYRSLSNCINNKIEQLGEQDREVMLLTYFKEKSQKELALFLGISYSGLKNRVQRAREKLKHSILACENVESDARGKITGIHENIP